MIPRGVKSSRRFLRVDADLLVNRCSRRRIPVSSTSISSKSSLLSINGVLRYYHAEKYARAADVKTNRPSSRTIVESDDDLPWLTQTKVPLGFWREKSNQRRYLVRFFPWITLFSPQAILKDWLGRKLGYRSREDWYKVTMKDFMENRGYPLLSHFNRSPMKLLTEVYTDYEFLPWLFSRVRKSYFQNSENRAHYIRWLMEKVGVKEMSELKYTHFRENAGDGILYLYNSSPINIINSLKEETDESKRSSALLRTMKPKHFWKSRENQRALLDSIGREIGVNGTDLSPWYSVSTLELKKLKADGLLHHYKGSICDMVSSVYPEYNWNPFKFRILPRKIIRNPNVFLKQALDFTAEKLDIQIPTDWYRVSHAQLNQFGVFQVIDKNGGLSASLRKAHPDVEWDLSKFVEAKVTTR